MRTLKKYIERMIELCERVQLYKVWYESFEKFSQDKKTIDATSMILIQLGETANSIKKHHYNFFGNTLKEMIGMRNILTHMYFKSNIEIIYNTATKDIPLLLNYLKSELSTLDHEN